MSWRPLPAVLGDSLRDMLTFILLSGNLITPLAQSDDAVTTGAPHMLPCCAIEALVALAKLAQDIGSRRCHSSLHTMAGKQLRHCTACHVKVDQRLFLSGDAARTGSRHQVTG